VGNKQSRRIVTRIKPKILVAAFYPVKPTLDHHFQV